MRSRSFWWLTGLAGLAALVFGGCADRGPSSPRGAPAAAPPATRRAPAETLTRLPEPAAASIELKTVTFAEFEQALARHKDKVVVVDFWAEF